MITDDEDLPGDKRSTRSGGKSNKKAENKPFGCAICGKSFLNRSYVESHIASHIRDQKIKQNIVFHHGEMPFKCDTCGEGFDEIKNLKKHLKTHPRERKSRKQKKKLESVEEDDIDIPDEIYENDLQNFENDIEEKGKWGIQCLPLRNHTTQTCCFCSILAINTFIFDT